MHQGDPRPHLLILYDRCGSSPGEWQREGGVSMAKGIAGLGRRRARGATVSVPPGKKVVLHVGCGQPEPESLDERFRGPEWHELRLDIDPSVEPDIIGTIVDMTAVADESVDGVWSSHNLEHVYAHEVETVLGEFRRVLRPGGIALLSVPDLQRIAKQIASGDIERPFYQSEAGGITPLDVLYGHGRSIAGGNTYMAHHTGFTAKTLAQKLRDAGFVGVDVKKEEIALLYASGRKPG
jgi:protein O-GlcNAc transferase